MADIDTIEVLDNLQFEHLDTADIYTVVAVGEAGEPVKSIPVALPIDVSAARVIINNGYGATGSTVYGRVRVTGITDLSSLTKIQNVQPLEWTSIALATVAECTEIDCSTYYGGMIHVDIAIVGTTAHLGTEVIVQVRKEATVNEWSTLTRFVVLSGVTAVKADVASTAAAGQKVIATANPTTNFGSTKINKFIFIVDATIAQCEIVYITACGADS